LAEVAANRRMEFSHVLWRDSEIPLPAQRVYFIIIIVIFHVLWRDCAITLPAQRVYVCSESPLSGVCVFVCVKTHMLRLCYKCDAISRLAWNLSSYFGTCHYIIHLKQYHAFLGTCRLSISDRVPRTWSRPTHVVTSHARGHVPRTWSRPTHVVTSHARGHVPCTWSSGHAQLCLH